MFYRRRARAFDFVAVELSTVLVNSLLPNLSSSPQINSSPAGSSAHTSVTRMLVLPAFEVLFSILATTTWLIKSASGSLGEPTLS